MKTNLSKVYKNMPNRKKVNLGIVDNLQFSTSYLSDEVGNLAYLVNDVWYNKYEELLKLYRELMTDFGDAETVNITRNQVDNEIDVLMDIQDAAFDLGVDTDKVYPDLVEHNKYMVEVLGLFDQFEALQEKIIRFPN